MNLRARSESVRAGRHRHWTAAGFLVAGFAGSIVLYHVDPVTTTRFPPCPVHKITGLHCPGCGSMRAVHQLLHGHVAAAFAFNPLMVAMLLMIAGALIARRIGMIPSGWVLPAAYIRLLLGVILMYAVLRNVPYHPFALLAPHAI